MRVGFIGAGRMGAPMVRRLSAAGHRVRVLGRSPEKRDAAAQLGAEPVSSAAEAARDADAVVVCVFTDEQVRQVCLDGDLAAAMTPGAVLILHTTGSPNTAAAVAERVAAAGVTVLDAPVSGGPHDVAAGTVTLFVGGDDDAFTRAEPLLSAYGDPVLHVGPAGAGQKVKLVNNAVFAANIGLVAEAVRLARRLGVDEPALLAALVHGSAASRALAGIAATGSTSAFAAAVGEFIGKDVAAVRAAAADLGADLGLLDAAAQAGLRPGQAG